MKTTIYALLGLFISIPSFAKSSYIVHDELQAPNKERLLKVRDKYFTSFAESKESCIEKSIADMVYYHSRLWDDLNYNQVKIISETTKENYSEIGFELSNGDDVKLGNILLEIRSTDKDSFVCAPFFEEKEQASGQYFFELEDQIQLNIFNLETYCQNHHCN